MIDRVLLNVENAQKKQKASYARRQLHGKAPLQVEPAPEKESYEPSKALESTSEAEDIPSCSKAGRSLPVKLEGTTKASIDFDADDPVMTTPCKKRKIREGDFIVAKINKVSRKEGQRKGKCAKS